VTEPPPRGCCHTSFRPRFAPARLYKVDSLDGCPLNNLTCNTCTPPPPRPAPPPSPPIAPASWFSPFERIPGGSLGRWAAILPSPRYSFHHPGSRGVVALADGSSVEGEAAPPSWLPSLVNAGALPATRSLRGDSAAAAAAAAAVGGVFLAVALLLRKRQRTANELL